MVPCVLNQKSLPQISEEGFWLLFFNLLLPTVSKISAIGIFTPATAVIPSGPPAAKIVFSTAKTTVPPVATAKTTLAAPATKATLTVASAETALPASTAGAAIPLETTPATLAVFHGPGFVDHNGPGTQRAAVEFLNGGLRLEIGRHFNKSEPLGTSRHFIHDDFSAFNASTS